MRVSDIQDIISNINNDIAFIIGNGINRYPDSSKMTSWDDLLITLWKKVSQRRVLIRPEGVSTTEFYDLLEIENSERREQLNIKKLVKDNLSRWEPKDHHVRIVERIRELNAPLLTTNFEEIFAKSVSGVSLFKRPTEKFTDFYPWSSYHSDVEIESPVDGFGIWYMNGMINYHRSIRLGLTDYMGSVQRTRSWLHASNEEQIFEGKNQNQWIGYNTWLHTIFNKSLFIFGLGLTENETFIRWLLIERHKYFIRYPHRRKQGYYLQKEDSEPCNIGKKFFLENLGFRVLEVESYESIYNDLWI